MYANSINSIVFAAIQMIESVIGHTFDKSQNNNKMIVSCDDILKRMEEGRLKLYRYIPEKHKLEKTNKPIVTICQGRGRSFYNEVDFV